MRLLLISATLVLSLPSLAQMPASVDSILGRDAILGVHPAAPPATQQPAPAETIRLTREQALRIGKKIWRNESGGTVAGLTHWNKGEAFASVGIGHFIWYPKGKKGPFVESFPLLLRYMASHGAELPEWLRDYPPCPWRSRAHFFRRIHTPLMAELRTFLKTTVDLQALFAAERLEAALPLILETLPAAERPAVRAQFFRVASEPTGVYALVDYVNFKGEGTSPTERYQGQGWGLLQVLQGMQGEKPGQPALGEFAASADSVLTRRVANSPAERDEAQWLSGWRKRVATYRD